jgi:hypothetical protein
MIEQIKKNYRSLADAVIESIHFKINDYRNSTKSLIVILKCFNHQMDKWQLLKINFFDVKYFRFIETTKLQNSVIFEALLKNDDSKIVIDFFPTQIDGQGKLEENPNSSFVIHCVSLTYEVSGFNDIG